jgi:DNA polymerase III alpha subunit (gram-positive type)
VEGQRSIKTGGHKNVLGIWFDFLSKVKYSTIFTFKAIFYVKNQPNLSDLFSLMIIKIGKQLLLLKKFDNFDF